MLLNFIILYLMDLINFSSKLSSIDISYNIFWRISVLSNFLVRIYLFIWILTKNYIILTIKIHLLMFLRLIPEKRGRREQLRRRIHLGTPCPHPSKRPPPPHKRRPGHVHRFCVHGRLVLICRLLPSLYK